MKRILLAIVITMLGATNLWAAAGSWSTWTYDAVASSSTFKTMSVTMTGGTAGDAGTVPNLVFDATTLAYIKGWYLYAVETNPGTVAPTDLYDVVINDAHGLDIMGTRLTNRSTSSTECAFPKWPYPSIGFPPLDGSALAVVVTNNAVASSTVVFKFYLAR